MEGSLGLGASESVQHLVLGPSHLQCCRCDHGWFGLGDFTASALLLCGWHHWKVGRLSGLGFGISYLEKKEVRTRLREEDLLELQDQNLASTMRKQQLRALEFWEKNWPNCFFHWRFKDRMLEVMINAGQRIKK